METADALVETVQSLWPSGRVELVRSRRTDPVAVAEFAVVPHARAPRLLVPASDARAAARSLWRFNAAASPRETWARTALAAAVRAGGLAPFGDRIRVHDRADDSLTAHLSGIVGEPISFSLGIGTARVNRKPVLQLFGRAGRSLGFVKVGNSRQATADVRAEATSLADLAGRSWRTLVVPDLLHHGTWSGMELLVMSALPTSPWQRPRDQWRLPRDAMSELGAAFAEESRPLAALPWFRKQQSIATGLTDTGAAARFLEAIDAVAARAGDQPWDVGAWHGDWTPWNMARRGGRIQLWDWERFERGVPVGIDPFHYCVNAVTRRDGTSPETILRGLELAGADRTQPGTRTHQLAGLYLLAATGRYLPLIAAEEGRHIADRAQHTLDALHLWTRGEVGSTRS